MAYYPHLPDCQVAVRLPIVSIVFIVGVLALGALWGMQPSSARAQAQDTSSARAQVQDTTMYRAETADGNVYNPSCDLEETVEAEGQHKQEDFELKALGRDRVNRLGHQPADLTERGLNALAVDRL